MIWLMAVAAFAIDRITKMILIAKVPLNASVPVIDGVFHITHVRNYGAGFSILQGKQLLLIFIGIAAALFFLFYSPKLLGDTPLMLIASGMVAGGTLGNLYDRIVQGFVIDFMDFKLINFAIFNLADSFIVVGMALVMFAVYQLEEHNH